MTALFLDRDGVINRRIMGDYVRRPEELDILPDIFSVLPAAHAAGMAAIVITNQRGIARGLMSEADLAAVHEQMQQRVEERTGHRFDAVYYCPHDRDSGCDCRKPLPGMLLSAAREHGIDLGSSWMVGDTESDIEAGIAAGCSTALVAEPGTPTRATLTAPSLAGIWAAILAHTHRNEHHA